MNALSDQTIKDFYCGDLKKILTKNSLRAFIKSKDQDALIELNKLWEENQERWGEPEKMNDILINLIIQRIEPQYREFEKRVNAFVESIFTLNSDDLMGDGIDFIILNNVRIIKHENQIVPNFYFRRNPDSTQLGDLKRSWIQVSSDEFKNIEVLQSKYSNDASWHKKKVNTLLEHIFMLATWLQFKSDQLVGFRYLTGAADCKWAIKKLGGITERGSEFVQDGWRESEEKNNEYNRVCHISGLLGYLYLRQNNGTELEEKVMSARKKIGTYFKKCLSPNQFQYLENIALKHGTPYFKLAFCDYIEQHKEIFDFWAKDSVNKLIYLNYFEYDGGKNKLNAVPKDYFSYDKMIIGGSQCVGAYNFPSKKSMRRAFALNQDIFLPLITTGKMDNIRPVEVSDFELKVKRNYWRNFMLWLDYIDHPEHLNHFAINNSRKIVESLLLNNTSTKMSKQIPFLVDLIYQYYIDMQYRGDVDIDLEVIEIKDYMQGNVYEFSEDGEIIKTRTKNAYLLNKKTTLKSLRRKSEAWHRDTELYNQVQMLRMGEDYKEQIYGNLNDLVVEKGMYIFTLIKNHYDLLMEGVEMHHCVESFHRRICKGEYAVFSILNKESEPLAKSNRFTLGLYLNEGQVRLDQCKGVYNSKISSDLKATVEEFIEAINNKEISLVSSDQKKKSESSP